MTTTNRMRGRYRQAAIGTTQVPPRLCSITEAARLTGVSASALRVWTTRYGWPCPRRTGGGQKRFSPAEILMVRRVVAAVAAGASLRELLASGSPNVAMLDQPVAPPAPRPDLDLGELAAPRTSDGDQVRKRLKLALIQRHPGLVRQAIAERLRLHPADREACVDGVLRLAAEQLDNPPWLLEAMHA